MVELREKTSGGRCFCGRGLFKRASYCGPTLLEKLTVGRCLEVNDEYRKNRQNNQLNVALEGRLDTRLRRFGAAAYTYLTAYALMLLFGGITGKLGGPFLLSAQLQRCERGDGMRRTNARSLLSTNSFVRKNTI